MPVCDEFFMRTAFNVAMRGLGKAWPNPAVGAVIVDSKKAVRVLARGWTGEGGRPHAEVVALEKLGRQAKDCTLYVTLEPCSHRAKTPPCADAIIASGISRVVCSIQDPDPRVSGQGLEKLQQAGINVTSGVLAREGHWLALGHILRTERNRPFVQLKFAVGADGRIPRGDGKPVWVSGPQARAHAHLLRARADAILIGSGTVSADNPTLTCRLPGMIWQSPVRIVLNSKGDIAENTRLVQTVDSVPLWVVTDEKLDSCGAQSLKDRGIEVLTVPRNVDDQQLDVNSTLKEIAQRGITRLLVEGGPTVASGFWDQDLVDEVIIYNGTEKAGQDGIIPFGGRGIEIVMQDNRFELAGDRQFGDDQLRTFRRKHSAAV